MGKKDWQKTNVSSFYQEIPGNLCVGFPSQTSKYEGEDGFIIVVVGFCRQQNPLDCLC